MQRRRIRSSALALLGASLFACGGEGGRAALADTAYASLEPEARPAATLDTALARQLAGFRRTVVTSPPRSMAGERSRDALVRRFARALERADTNDFRAMAMNRAEFAYLYFPESRHTRAPYRQDPALTWFLIQQGSDKGLTRLMGRMGGKPLVHAGYRCDGAPDRQGETTFWPGCRVRLVAPSGDTADVRLFGSIVERDGRFKFMSYANDL